MKNYLVSLYNTSGEYESTVNIVAEQLKIEDRLLIFLSNNVIVASFKEWDKVYEIKEA